jgi:uncharacterized protein YgbK (DUF1537 family)
MTDELPRDRPIFSFYGDDFTGSTDSLDALARNGIPSVLFLHPPREAELKGFARCRAVGIAGESRSQPPAWMRGALPAVFETLRRIGAPVVQYKVCSTFDSSPETGSIGCALEIGQDVLGVPFVPVVPAAPVLRRYLLFGNLFAAAGETVYRIDRHPTMRQHPVTPMDEADLRLHLARQTSRRVALMDLLALADPDARARLERLIEERAEAVLFDGLDAASLEKSAALIWESRRTPQCFVVGSSGFTHAMLDYWRTRGWLDGAGAGGGASVEAGAGAGPGAATPPHPADRIVVMSGSCSPATERQIQHALHAGFSGVRLNAAQLARPGANGPYQEAVLAKALGQLSKGHSVVLYSALGPLESGAVPDRQALASEMGKLLRALIARSGVHRAVVAGGDTSSHAVRELEISALTFLAPLAPGAPLCQAFAQGARASGLELVLKGGQVGSDKFFEEVLRGVGCP